MATAIKDFLHLVLEEDIEGSRVNDFIVDNKFVIDKLFVYPKLKVNFAFHTLWKFFFGFFSTEHQYRRFLRDTSVEEYNDGLIEVILHSPSFEFVKNISPIYNVDEYKAYIDKLRSNIDDKTHIRQFVIHKICHKFGVQPEQSMMQQNPLLLYVKLLKEHVQLPSSQANTNPVSKHSIIGDYNNKYPFDQLQEAILGDRHFMMKLLNQPVVCLQHTCNLDAIKELLELFKKEKKRPVIINVSEQNCSHFKSMAYVFDTQPQYIHHIPSVCEKFILVSNKRYPEFRSLAREKKHSLYYLHVLEESEIQDNTISAHQKTYDHCVTSIPYKFNNQASCLKTYRLLDPLATGPKNIPAQVNQLRILAGPASIGNPKLQELGDSAATSASQPQQKQTDVYTKINKRTDYNIVFDVHNEIPMTKLLELGCKGAEIEATNRKLPKFTDCSPLIFSKQMFEKMWRSHLSVECPHGNPNNPINNMIAFDEFILSYCDNVKIQPDVLNPDAKNTIIILDNRENALSVLSVLFALANIAKGVWKCKVFTSRASYDYYSQYLTRYGVEIVHLEDMENVLFDIDVYNGIMKSPSFWERVGGDKVLIIQDDGFLMKKGVERFLEYDYVGAPWADAPVNEFIKQHVNKDLVGNGGFSLRDVHACKRVTQKYENEKYALFSNNIVEIPEDVYFVQCMVKEGMKVAPQTAACFFASEQALHPGALGMHKPWPYTRRDHLEQFLNTFL